MAEKKPRREYGDGSIYQRKSDNRFVGSFYTQDGQRKYVYGDTRAEAKKKLAEAQKQAEAGLLVPVDKQTLAGYLEEWIETKKRQWEPSSYQTNMSRMHRHIIPSLGKIKLQKLTMQQVQKFINALSDEKELASPSVIATYAILQSACSDAAKQKLIGANPCADIVLPRLEEREYVALSAEQSQAFLEAVKGHKLEGLVTVALATALRRGELLGLKWSDIDLEKGYLNVKHNVTYINGKGFNDGSPKTRSGRRTITLVSFAIEALKEHRKRQLEQRLKAPQWKDLDLVFPNTRGSYMQPSAVDQLFKRFIMTKFGLPEMRLHDLRHSCATLLLSKGVSPKVVQEILGHANIAITLKVYGHALPGMHEEAMQMYGNLLMEEKKKKELR